MKKYIIILAVSWTAWSCNKQHSLAMKSNDKDLILNTANEFYAQKKWAKAIALYDRLPNMVAGTDDAAEVAFKTAYANYYDKNYRLAGHQFKSFANTFTKDPRREEAAYLSALCYYNDAAEYNLDQSSTETAINNLQDFISNYPQSEKVKDVNTKIEDLSRRLEKKYYEHAKQYFRMMDYRAAVTEFENLLEDFPSTQYRKQSISYIMKAKYELGMHSIFDLKKDRLENAIAFTRQIEKDYPNEPDTKEAISMRDRLSKELEKHNQTLQEVEAKKAELLEKQKQENQ